MCTCFCQCLIIVIDKEHQNLHIYSVVILIQIMLAACQISSLGSDRYCFFNAMLDWKQLSILDILNYVNCFPNFPSLAIKADKIGYKGNSTKALGRLSQKITLCYLSWSTSLPCFCSVYQCLLWSLWYFILSVLSNQIRTAITLSWKSCWSCPIRMQPES